jgi:hypothetical protein
MFEGKTKGGGPVALPTTERVVATAMAAGAGFNTGAVTWITGRGKRRKRSPRRAEIRALKSRRRRWLRKHGRAHPDLAAVGRIIAGCRRGRFWRRCLHPACPECAHALQRLLVRTVGSFTASEPKGAWVTMSVILPASGPDGEADFVAARDQAEMLLREAGVTVGVLGLDVSFNEDHRDALPENERFADHASVHLYGLVRAEEAPAAKMILRWLIPSTEAIRRPVHTKIWDGNPTAVAYAHKPEFQRRQTILKADAKRGKPVRTTRDRPLTVEQQIQAVRALDRAGLTGRIVLLGLALETTNTGRLRLVPAA